jgi:hypothetical protein
MPRYMLRIYPPADDPPAGDYGAARRERVPAGRLGRRERRPRPVAVVRYRSSSRRTCSSEGAWRTWALRIAVSGTTSLLLRVVAAARVARIASGSGARRRFGALDSIRSLGSSATRWTASPR